MQYTYSDEEELHEEWYASEIHRALCFDKSSPADCRMAYIDWVDNFKESGLISSELAYSVSHPTPLKDPMCLYNP